MRKLIAFLVLGATLATASCVDEQTQIPRNKVDQGSYVGAPGSGAP